MIFENLKNRANDAFVSIEMRFSCHLIIIQLKQDLNYCYKCLNFKTNQYKHRIIASDHRSHIDHINGIIFNSKQFKINSKLNTNQWKHIQIKYYFN